MAIEVNQSNKSKQYQGSHHKAIRLYNHSQQDHKHFKNAYSFLISVFPSQAKNVQNKA